MLNLLCLVSCTYILNFLLRYGKAYSKPKESHLFIELFPFSDRTLVFGNKTGVNLHGEIVLGSEDVPTEWMSVSYY